MCFRFFILLRSTFIGFAVSAQSKDTVYSFTVGNDVQITIDMPAMNQKHKTIIIIYALPNGNTIGQTMGKKMNAGDDWHYDIQHISAQTKFIRNALPMQNIVVAYLANKYNSWPQFKKVHSDFAIRIPHTVDTVFSIIPSRRKLLYLNGHSGGGSFIFGYLDGVVAIPNFIRRISFLDSDYGYDSIYVHKIQNWMLTKNKYLNIFAYNDSVALLDGKPFVSATGGTWYRSKLMMQHLSASFHLKKIQDDSLTVYKGLHNRITFFFKTNPERKIFHTVQVERNGFIHSVLSGTKQDSQGYIYYGERAYSDLIQ